MKTIKVTELEKKVLEALAEEMYAEWGFSDAGLYEVQKHTKISLNILRGVAGSLVKKGFMEIDKREDEGHKNNPLMHIWYLRGCVEGLVEHWIEESGGKLEAVILEA